MKVLINLFLIILVTGMDHGYGKLHGKNQGIGQSRIDLNRFKKNSHTRPWAEYRGKICTFSRMPMAGSASTSGIFDQSPEMNPLVFIRKA